jgi:RNA polymerase sigma-70 factor (ECF subfamily)
MKIKTFAEEPRLVGPSELHEDRLVLAAQSGDGLAFAELTQRHSQLLLRTIYRIVNSWEDAEDILQETLLKAFVRIKTFEGRSRVSTWLTRIAINSALMALRKRRAPCSEIAIDSSCNDDHNGIQFQLQDARDNPEQLYWKNEKTASLDAAIARLHPNLRIVIELQREHEYSGEELAQSLGISLAAVKSRLLRARTALRESLQDLAPDRPKKGSRVRFRTALAGATSNRTALPGVGDYALGAMLSSHFEQSNRLLYAENPR